MIGDTSTRTSRPSRLPRPSNVATAATNTPWSITQSITANKKSVFGARDGGKRSKTMTGDHRLDGAQHTHQFARSASARSSSGSVNGNTSHGQGRHSGSGKVTSAIPKARRGATALRTPRPAPTKTLSAPGRMSVKFLPTSAPDALKEILNIDAPQSRNGRGRGGRELIISGPRRLGSHVGPLKNKPVSAKRPTHSQGQKENITIGTKAEAAASRRKTQSRPPKRPPVPGCLPLSNVHSQSHHSPPSRPHSRLGHYANTDDPKARHTDLTQTPLKPRHVPIKAVVPRRTKTERVRCGFSLQPPRPHSTLTSLPTLVIAHSPHSSCRGFQNEFSSTTVETSILKRSVWTLTDEIKLIKNGGVVPESDVQIVAPEAHVVPLCSRTYNGVIPRDSVSSIRSVCVELKSGAGSLSTVPPVTPTNKTPQRHSRVALTSTRHISEAKDMETTRKDYAKSGTQHRQAHETRNAIGRKVSDSVTATSIIVAVSDSTGATEEVSAVLDNIGVISPPIRYPGRRGKSLLTRAHTLMKFVGSRSRIGKVVLRCGSATAPRDARP